MASLKSPILLAALALAIGSAPVLAQTATPAPTAQTAAPAVKLTPEKKAQISKDCSAQADQQKLHGKERKKFRAECKHKATM